MKIDPAILTMVEVITILLALREWVVKILQKRSLAYGEMTGDLLQLKFINTGREVIQDNHFNERITIRFNQEAKVQNVEVCETNSRRMQLFFDYRINDNVVHFYPPSEEKKKNFRLNPKEWFMLEFTIEEYKDYELLYEENSIEGIKKISELKPFRLYLYSGSFEFSTGIGIMISILMSEITGITNVFGSIVSKIPILLAIGLLFVMEIIFLNSYYFFNRNFREGEDNNRKLYTKKKINRWNMYKTQLRKLLNWFPGFFFLLVFLSISLYLVLLVNPGYESLENFGLKGFLSFPPLVYVVYFGLSIRELRFSSILGALAFLIHCVIWYHCYPLLSTTVIMSFSVFYGIIAANCCLLGLRIEGQYISHNLPDLRNNIIFVSVAVVAFLFVLGRLIESEIYWGALLTSFVFLALAISFFYLVFGYSSKKEGEIANPFILFIYLIFCFSIGVTFSTFILELGRIGGLFPSHWVFLCIWSLFLCSLCLIISKREFGFYDWIQNITRIILGQGTQ
ncbi:MAG: hypothetical protein HXS48_00040 [Theionarchaea archaeon]|nr:hypothetical protein [Theionarchaea archaeon]